MIFVCIFVMFIFLVVFYHLKIHVVFWCYFYNRSHGNHLAIGWARFLRGVKNRWTHVQNYYRYKYY